MSDQPAFERVLASLYDAMLDDTRWPATSALIDEACGLTGNGLIVTDGPKDDVRLHVVGLYFRGQRHEDLERDYVKNYHSMDERVPRFRQLPSSRLVHATDLYTAEELKTSPTYNELMHQAVQQDSLNVRLSGLDGSHIAWCLNDPADSDGWGSSRITTVTRLLPHIRQFVRVRQALVRAQAGDTTVTALLENTRIGILHLDRRRRILAANDRARRLLRRGAGVSDEGGVLQARAPDDQARLARVVSAALPTSSAVPVSGSMLLGRAPGVPPLVMHVKPVRVPPPDYGVRPVAALVLLVEPGYHPRLDPAVVTRTLGLTPAESQVAVWLADGQSVRDIARTTGLTENAIYWHLKQIYQKLPISRQVDLVRLVLSIAEFG